MISVEGLNTRLPRTGEALEANMFDSIEDQMKNVAMSGSTAREKWMRYLLISAVAVVAVGGLIAAAELVR